MPKTDQSRHLTNEIMDKPDYFLLRPEIENAYGYSHAVKIGNLFDAQVDSDSMLTLRD